MAIQVLLRLVSGLAISLALYASMTRFACAEPPPKVTTPSGITPYVKSPTIEEFENLRSAMDPLALKLIALMNDESTAPANRVSAMGALGAIRSPHAELPLVENLLYTQGEVTRLGPLVSYPAARACTNYGRHLYEAAWAAVDQERPDNYLYVLAVTFAVMDGEEVAIIRVQEWADQPGATPAQLDNFRKVLRYLKSTDFHDPTTWPRVRDPNPTD